MAIQDELAFELDIEPQVLTPNRRELGIKADAERRSCSTAYRLLETVFQIERKRAGISEDGSVKEYLQFGRKKLLPPEIVARLENIDSVHRYALEENSFKCFWGGLSLLQHGTDGVMRMRDQEAVLHS